MEATLAMAVWGGASAARRVLRCARAGCPRDSRRDAGATEIAVSLLARAQPAQSPRRLIQRLFALAKCKSHLPSPVPGIIVEARARNCGHPDLLDQVTREPD